MIRLYPNEVFKELSLEPELRLRYAISNRGRLASFTDTIEKGTELSGGYGDGYKVFRYRVKVDGVMRYKCHFFYKMVAEHFMPKTSEDQTNVIHLDYKRDHDKIENLRWVTKAELREHINRSPHVQESRRKLIEFNIKSDGKKLTATKVMHIKKLLQNPDRKNRLKMIAKQFNISQTHLKRIETGENWGHIKI